MKRIYNGVEVTFTNETDYNQSNVVYLITFPDGKYYVGSTTLKLRDRIIAHCGHSITSKKQYLISKPIREFMKFEVKILDVENDKNTLRKLEEFFTVEYQSNEEKYGYNDDSGHKHSDEYKLKLSKSCRGKSYSEESKLKMSTSKGHPFLDDFNNQFRSLYHAAEYYKCSHNNISKLLKSGKKSKKLGTGFKYIE